MEAKELSTRLDAAVLAGVIDRAAADRLSAFLLREVETELPSDPDDEKLRLVTGFNDIFVTIGLVMFLGALGYLTAESGGVVAALAIAAAAWGLAEFFTRIRRMALPSIVLLVVFAASVFMATTGLVSGEPGTVTPFNLDSTPAPLMIGGAAMALAAWLHWWRFHVPITVAAGVSALAVIVLAALSQIAPDLVTDHPIPVFLPLGLAIFALAMWFDMSDRLRQTRRTDIAFWLHLLAAPIIVHPILMTVSGASGTSASGALLVVGVFLALSIVALVVDRRAILVSSLSYLAYAAGTLIAAAGLDSSSFAVSTLVVGTVALMLSAAWRPLRRSFVGLLPNDVRQRVPVAA